MKMPPAWRKNGAFGRVSDFQKAKAYILYKLVEIYLGDVSTRKGLTIYKIYEKLGRHPAIRLFYEYIRELTQNGFVKTTSGNPGDRAALYVPTEAAIKYYYALREQVERETDSRIPSRNAFWDVTVRKCDNQKIPRDIRERLYGILVHYQHLTILTSQLLKFVCVRTDKAFTKSLNDEATEFTWKIPHRDYLPLNAELFNMKRVQVTSYRKSITGETINLRKGTHELSDQEVVLMYTHPRLSEELSEEVKISYDFETVLPRDCYQFFVKSPWRTRGFKLRFDHSKVDWSEVVVCHYFGPQIVPSMTLDKVHKVVQIDVNDGVEILPGSGVSLFWTKQPTESSD